MIYLKDVVKEGMTERFDQLRAMGIRTVMVTGDNRLTAAKIADEAGVDDFLAEATPREKLELIRGEQADGRLIAMTGDGTNDAPALAQADVGVTMNTGTQAAREAGNMVDLDSNPTKLIEIVEVGKQLLITRGALTTFSIANDVAKYFAILPAIFAATYAAAGEADGPLDRLNVMNLGTPESAIISAIVFNALVIPLLVPLALRGVALPAARRLGSAAPQSLDLRPRRHDRPVRRDQAHRPARPWCPRRLSAEREPGTRPEGPSQGLPRDGRRGRQDLPDAPGGALRGRRRTGRRDRLSRDPRPPRDGGAGRGAGADPPPPGRAPRGRRSRRWTCPGSSSAPPSSA